MAGTTVTPSTDMTREQFIRAVQRLVSMGMMTQAQADTATRTFDNQGGGTPGVPAAGAGPVNPLAGGGSGGVPNTEYITTPEMQIPRWVESQFANVIPGVRDKIGDLAKGKYWDWALTRSGLPGYESQVGPQDFQSFLQRELQGSGLSPAMGRQAGWGDIQRLVDMVSAPNQPFSGLTDAASAFQQSLYNEFQPNAATNMLPLESVTQAIGSVAGNIPAWLRGTFQNALENRFSSFQGQNPYSRLGDFANFAKNTLGIGR